MITVLGYIAVRGRFRVLGTINLNFGGTRPTRGVMMKKGA